MPADHGRVEPLRGPPDVVARRVLDHAAGRPPTLGEGRLVSIDGPAGSGKTTLGRRLVDLEPGARLVHMDDLFAGWDGLPTVDRQLTGLLRPLAAGHSGHYRRYDWDAGAWAERVEVPPTRLLVVEGVGSGSRQVADLVTALVWVEAPYRLRMRRGLDRDGEAFAPHWRSWARAERTHFATHGTRARADIVVDTGAGEGVTR